MIRGRLATESIAICGGTGFLGKALVEKLLWALPEVARLTLLVRPARGESAEDRVRRDFAESAAFARLRARHGKGFESWLEDRVRVVQADVTVDRLGLSAGEHRSLAREITLVINAAASVKFDERLDVALAVNVRGAGRLLDLARDAGDAPLVHVSTCFASGPRAGTIHEDFSLGGVWARPGVRFRPERHLEDLEAECRAVAAAHRDAPARALARALVRRGSRVARRHGWSDIYTYSKWLGEQSILQRRKTTPVVVLRPSVIESARRDPAPGWIEGVRVADPLIVAYGRGLLQEFPGRPATVLDIVPVDHVVNAILAVVPRPGDAARVYQVCSGERHPITLGLLAEYCARGYRDAAQSGAPRDRYSSPVRFVPYTPYVLRLGAALLLARLGRSLAVGRLRRRLGKAARRASRELRQAKLYRAYTFNVSRFSDSNLVALWADLDPAEREEFPFDSRAVEWESYIRRVHVPGLLRLLARRKLDRRRPSTSPSSSKFALEARR